jgi:hypothetical protein
MCLLVAGASRAAEERLAWKWKPGESFYVEMTIDVADTTELPELGRLSLKEAHAVTLVLQVTPGSTAKGDRIPLDVVIRSLKITRGPLNWDAGLKRLVGGKFTAAVNSKGQVQGPAEIDGLVKRPGWAAGKVPADAGLGTAFVRSFCTHVISEAILPLPDQPARKGIAWQYRRPQGTGLFTRVTLDKTFTDEGTVKEGDAGVRLRKVSVKGSVQVAPAGISDRVPYHVTKAEVKEQDGKGTAFFDLARGRLVRSEMRLETRVALTLRMGGKPFLADSKRVQKVTVRVTDEPPR